MITKIEVDSHMLTGISHIDEIAQNEGEYVLKGLTINILENKENTMAEIEKIFSGKINKIKVYEKEEIPKGSPEEEQQYSEEKLSREYSDYNGVKSIYHSLDWKTFTVCLSMSATQIADHKYKELLAEKEKLEQTDNNVLLALTEQFESFNNAQNEILLAIAELYESMQK